MKTILFSLITIITAVFVFSSCGDNSTQPPVSNNNDSCGADNNPTHTYHNPFLGQDRPNGTSLQGGQRTYNFYFRADSICTDNHVKALFFVRFVNSPPISCRAALEWMAFWEVSDTGHYGMQGVNRIWESKIEDVGLKVPFGESAANAYPNIYLSFPTQGSLAADSIYLVQHVEIMAMDVYAKFHKPGTTTSDNLINKDNYKDIAFIFDNKRPSSDVLKSPDLYDKKGTFILRDYNLF